MDPYDEDRALEAHDDAVEEHDAALAREDRAADFAPAAALAQVWEIDPALAR